MRGLFRRNDRERGTAVVEFSIVFGLLLMLALGTFEYGMAFRDWLSVTVSAREGGRVGASAGTFSDADCIILEASAGALQSLSSGDIQEIHIYQSDSSGNYPGAASSSNRRYRPAATGDDPVDLVACGGSDWFPIHLGGNWDPADRDNSGTNADWIGVRVEFEHEWMTNFLWWNGTVDYADDAVFRLEPPPPS